MLCLVVCSGCWSVDCATLHRACLINWKKRRGVGFSHRKKVEKCQKNRGLMAQNLCSTGNHVPKSWASSQPTLRLWITPIAKAGDRNMSFSYQSINFIRKITTRKLTVLVVGSTSHLAPLSRTDKMPVPQRMSFLASQAGKPVLKQVIENGARCEFYPNAGL